jgi:alkylhydroperoxidase family enzyme
VGSAQGLEADKVLHIADYAHDARFDVQERLVLELADALTSTPATVSDELWGRLRAHFDEPQLIELAASIAWENYRARFNRAFEVAAEGFSEAAACALPPPSSRPPLPRAAAPSPAASEQ